MPGGVNSPVRAFNSVGGQPVVFDRVKGACAYDVDGNEYIDYVGTWGPAIVGHANDEVTEALKAQVDKGALPALRCTACTLCNVVATANARRLHMCAQAWFGTHGKQRAACKALESMRQGASSVMTWRQRKCAVLDNA